MKKLIWLLVALFAATIVTRAYAGAIVREGYIVKDLHFLPILRVQPELTVDHVTPEAFEIYGPTGLGVYLTRIKAPFVPVEVNPRFAANYPTPEQVGEELKALAAAHPQTARLFSIGKSSKGRDLWVMKVSHNVANDDARPEFKYIANMHGDEIVGRELMVRLLRDLLEQDGKDQYITQLMNDVQIYIMPSMNPDGAASIQRGNAAWVDLNRDFPEFSHGDKEVLNGRAPETQAVMKWQATRKFVLSANYHGGAQVVSYPWDAIAPLHPQDALLKTLSLEYAHNAPYIAASTTFKNGITNGYEWYEVDGGMQDWSDRYHGDLQVTIELSNTKYPGFGDINYFEQQNKAAMLTFIGRVRNLTPFRR